MRNLLTAVLLATTACAMGQEMKAVAKLESSTPLQFAAICTGGDGAVGMGKDGTVYSWHLPEGKIERSFAPGRWTNKRRVRNATCSEKLIALGLDDGSAIIVNRQDGTEKRIQLGSRTVSTLEISPDSTLLAGAVADTRAELWDLREMKRIAVLPNDFGGSSALAFSPDSQRVASADEDTVVRIYDRAGKLLGSASQFTLDTFGLAFVNAGKELAAVGADGMLTMLDGVSGAQLRQVPKDSDVIFNIASAPDGHTVCVSYFDNFLLTPSKIGVWDTRTLKLVRTLSPKSMIGAGAGKTALLMVRTEDDHTASVLALP